MAEGMELSRIGQSLLSATEGAPPKILDPWEGPLAVALPLSQATPTTPTTPVDWLWNLGQTPLWALSS